jgi:hypothetical protein
MEARLRVVSAPVDRVCDNVTPVPSLLSSSHHHPNLRTNATNTIPGIAPLPLTTPHYPRYSHLCLSDPGRVTSPDLEHGSEASQLLSPCDQPDHCATDDSVVIDGSVDLHLRTCGKCALEAPLRSHHCHACRCCVRAFDHHCFWIGTCVGERNHALFASYLCLQTVVLVLALSFTGEAMQHAAGSYLHAATVIIMLCLFSALVMVGGLAAFHAYLLGTGQTTREVQAACSCAL